MSMVAAFMVSFAANPAVMRIAVGDAVGDDVFA